MLLEACGVGRLRPGEQGWLLHNVSLEVRGGDRLALAGPSGGGKTLLLRALALLDPLDVGAACWRGQPVAAAEVPAFRRRVAYLHQRPALFEGTVEDNLRLPFSLAVHREQSFDRERALALLATLGGRVVSGEGAGRPVRRRGAGDRSGASPPTRPERAAAGRADGGPRSDNGPPGGRVGGSVESGSRRESGALGQSRPGPGTVRRGAGCRMESGQLLNGSWESSTPAEG